MALQKVGGKALMVAQEKTALSLPTPPPKKVLDEDSYTKDLEKIIVRDFYPDLPKFKVQQEYLSALERNDTETIRRIHHKYGHKIGSLKTPSAMPTPSTFETPVVTSDGKATPATFETPVADPKQTPHGPGASQETPTRNPEPHEVKPKKTDADLTLDKYLTKNTSEDNASFGEMIKEAEKKHRIKHAWLFEKEEEQSEEQHKYLTLPSIEQQAITSGNPTKLDTWTYRPKNELMYVPEGAEMSAREKIDLEGKNPKEIIHTNTRFKVNPFNLEKSKASIQEAANTQAVMKTGRIGVDGKEVLPNETPKVAGYSFVGEPSPAPGTGPDESPMMTWGEIEGTPFRLDASDTPLVHKSSGPQFKIPAVPKRDQLGLQLAEKASKAHRAKKEQALKQAAATFAVTSPAFGKASKSDRIHHMSPAAQLLASSKLGIRTNTDKSLRDSYTPSPGSSSLRRDKTPLYGLKTPTPGSSTSRNRSSRKRLNNLVRTPGSTPELGMHREESPSVSSSLARRQQSEQSSTASLTDNMLNLPKKRPKAGDFF